jgi:hypothetical protein
MSHTKIRRYELELTFGAKRHSGVGLRACGALAAPIRIFVSSCEIFFFFAPSRLRVKPLQGVAA